MMDRGVGSGVVDKCHVCGFLEGIFVMMIKKRNCMA